MARDEIVLNNTALVWSVVRRFSKRGTPEEDLFQIGCIGLLKAVDNFDLSQNVLLSTYAVPLIMGEIKRYLRDDGLVRVSRSIKENSVMVQRAGETFQDQHKRQPTIEELCECTGLAKEDVVTAISASGQIMSIYSPAFSKDGEEIMIIDTLPSFEEKSQTEKVLDRMLLAKLLLQLDREEKKIIRMRYYEEKTQTDVARELGTNQVAVSRMEKKILNKMKLCAGIE